MSHQISGTDFPFLDISLIVSLAIVVSVALMVIVVLVGRFRIGGTYNLFEFCN